MDIECALGQQGPQHLAHVLRKCIATRRVWDELTDDTKIEGNNIFYGYLGVG